MTQLGGTIWMWNSVMRRWRWLGECSIEVYRSYCREFPWQCFAYVKERA